MMFADGFEEIEALTVVDVLRRAGMQVVTMSIYETPEAIGAHGVTVVADEVFNPEMLEDAEWIICPGGMPVFLRGFFGSGGRLIGWRRFFGLGWKLPGLQSGTE